MTNLLTAPDAPGGWRIAERVAAAIAGLQAGDPLAEVVVVTPPGPTAQTLRRLLAETGHGVAGVHFETPIDLARAIVTAHDGALRPTTPLLLAAVVQRELSGPDCPAVLEPIRHHPSTTESIVEVAERLRLWPLDGAPSGRRVTTGSIGQQAIADVAHAARRKLRRLGYHDEFTTLQRAIELLGSGPRPGLVPARVVVVLTDCLHPGQVPFLRAFLAAATATSLVVPTEWLDDPGLHAQAAQLGVPVDPVPGSPAPTPVALTSCPDQDEEVRHVVRRIVADAAAGVDLSSVAVLHPMQGGYRRRITDELDRAGIPWVGTAPQLLAESLHGTLLRLAFKAFAAPNRVNVLKLLAAAPFRVLPDEPRRTLSRWRRLCRSQEVVTPDHWDALRARLEHDDPDEGLHKNDREPARALLALVDVVRATAQQLNAATADGAPWTAAARALVGFVDRMVGPAHRRALLWDGLPDWQFKAGEQVDAALTALATLDATGIEAGYSLAELERLVLGVLTQPVRRVSANGPGVRVLQYTDALCLEAAVAYVVGATDRALPPSRADEMFRPAFGDADDALAGYVEHDRWQQHRVERAWRRLLASGAAVRASWPRSDMRQGGELYPARLLGAETAPVRVVESHASEAFDGPPIAAAEALLGDAAMWTRSEVLHRRSRALFSRQQPVGTEYDGQLGEGILDPTGRVHSITAFEKLARCGVSYLFRELGAAAERDAGEIDVITPLDKGDLAHRVVERLVDEWLARDPRPAWMSAEHVGTIEGAVERVLAEFEADLRERARLGHPVRWQIERRQLVTGLVAALTTERDEGLEPLAAEHEFGDLDDAVTEPLVLATPAGAVRFRGRIDRIDRVGGRVRVTDLKTTTSKNTSVSGNNPTEDGTKLQLPIYTLVAHRDFGTPDADPLPPRYMYVRGAKAEPREFPERATADALAHVARLAAQLAAGDLHPGVPDEMWGCDDCCPDQLGADHVAARALLFAAPAPEPDQGADG